MRIRNRIVGVGAVLLLALCLLLTACNQATSTKGGIELKLFTDKTIYETAEPIRIWANLTYKGDQVELPVRHGEQLVSFHIQQTDGPLDFKGEEAVTSKTTILKRGETYRVEYVKTAAYSKDDPNAAVYDAFLQGKEVRLPPGNYKLTATAKLEGQSETTTIVEDMDLKVTK